MCIRDRYIYLNSSVTYNHDDGVCCWLIVCCCSGNGRSINSSSSARSDASLAKKPSRHVSIHIPSEKLVVRPQDSVTALKQASAAGRRLLNLAQSCNTLGRRHSASPGGTRARSASTTVNARRGVGTKNANFPSKHKNPEATSSLPRLQKEHEQIANVCESSLSNASSYSAAGSSTDGSGGILSKASRKNTSTVLSGSDINRTLASEVKNGRMSKYLAKLVITLSSEKSQVLPLPKTEVTELRSWILSADSGCSKLPLSIRNYLNYVIRISDDNRYTSSSKTTRTFTINDVNADKNVQSAACKEQKYQTRLCRSASKKLLKKSGSNTEKDRPIFRNSSFYSKNESVQQEYDDDVDDDDDDDGMFLQKPKSQTSRDCKYVKPSTASRGQACDCDSKHAGKKSVAKQSSLHDAKNSPAFVEEGPDVLIKKITQNLQMRDALRNSSCLKTCAAKSSSLRKPNTQLRSGILSDNKHRSANNGPDQHTLKHSVSSSTAGGEDVVANSDISELLKDQNFSVRSHLQNMEKREARKASLNSAELGGCAVNERGSAARTINPGGMTSWKSRGCLAKRHVALKKEKVSGAAAGAVSRAGKSPAVVRPSSTGTTSGTPDLTTSSSSHAHDSSSSSAARRPPNRYPPNGGTGKISQPLKCNLGASGKMTCCNCGSVCEDSPNSVSPSLTSRNKPPPAAVTDSTSQKKVETTNNKKVPPKSSAQPANDAKVSGRWTDVGSWNGKVYTVSRVGDSTKNVTSKPANDKPRQNKTTRPHKTTTRVKTQQSQSKTPNARNKTSCDEKCPHQTSEQSSAETVISCQTSKQSLDTANVESKNSISSLDKPSPHFKVHSTIYRSDSRQIALKRHVKKPSPSNNSESPAGSSKSAPRCGGASSEKKSAQPKRPPQKPAPKLTSVRGSVKSALGTQALASVDSARSDGQDVGDYHNTTAEKPAVEVQQLDGDPSDDIESAAQADSMNDLKSEDVESLACVPPMSNRAITTMDWKSRQRAAKFRGSARRLASRFDDQQQQLSLCGAGLSDTESVAGKSDTTFLADHAWQFGMPPRSWVGSWSLSAANGSRSSLDTETDRDENSRLGDIVQSVSAISDGNRCDEPAKVASSDKAVSTDSEPELSSRLSLQASSSAQCHKEVPPNDRGVDFQTADAAFKVLSSSLSLSQQPYSDHQHSLVADDDSNSEDIHLESFPSGISSLISIDATSVHEEPRSTTAAAVDGRSASFNSNRSYCVLDNDAAPTAENDVIKTISSADHGDGEKTGAAENCKIQQQQHVEITKTSCEDSGNHGLNENVNHLVCSSSNSSPLSSDVRQRSDSKEQPSSGDKHVHSPDFVGVLSSESINGKFRRLVVSDSNSSSSSSSDCSTSFTRLNRSHLSSNISTHSQHGQSLTVIGNEKLQPAKNWQRNANSSDNLEVKSHSRYTTHLNSDIDTDAASLSKANVLRAKTLVDLKCRQQRASKASKLRETFANRATAVSGECGPAKDVFDTNYSARSLTASDEQMTLTSSGCDTSDATLSSNSVLHSDIETPNVVATDVQTDRQKPPAKTDDSELSDNESHDDGSPSIDYEVLKAAVARNMASIDSSNHNLEKPAAAIAEQLASDCCKTEHNQDTICSHSLKEPVRNNANRSSNHRETDSSSSNAGKDSAADCRDTLTVSSSSVTESDSSAFRSLDDDSTNVKTISSSEDTVVLSDGTDSRHVACDDLSPSSTGASCWQKTSTPDCDHPQFSADMESDTDTEDGSADEDEDEQTTTGVDVCFCEIPNANPYAFTAAAGFGESAEQRDSDECQRLCQSVDELSVARSRRPGAGKYRNAAPIDDVFTRKSVSAFHRDEQRDSAGFVSAHRHQKIPNLRGQEENDPRDALCLAENDGGCYESFAFSCRDYALGSGRRNSLSDLRRPSSHRVKVNCKSSYRAKLRSRPCKSGRRSALGFRYPARQKTDAAVAVMCSSYMLPRRHDFDLVHSGVCSQEAKRISCSQLYRMSRGSTGHPHTPNLRCSSPSECSTSNDVCSDISLYAAESCSFADDTERKLPPVEHSTKDGSKLAVPPDAALQAAHSNRSQSNAVYDPNDLAIAAAPGKTLSKEIATVEAAASERNDSADVVAAQHSADAVDMVRSSELLRHQRKPATGQ